MGTTKDPEGFRRHTAGRGSVLGVKGGGAKRRGCGLGLGVVLLALGVGAAAWSLRAARREVVAAPLGPLAESAGDLARAADLATPEAVERDRAVASLPEPERADSPGVFDVAPPTAAARSGSARGDARLRLLRGWSDAPLAGATVYWIGASELTRRKEAGLFVTTVELEPVLRRVGRRATTGSDGELTVDADTCHLLVLGEGWTRELKVDPAADGGRTEVPVFAPRVLAIDVVDWRGAPAPSIALEIQRVDVSGAARDRVAWMRTSPQSGGVRCQDFDTVLQAHVKDADDAAGRMFTCHVDMDLRSRREREAKQLPELERTRLRIAADPKLAPGVWADVDLAQDPLPAVRLRLPPLGELHVLVADAEGRPVAWPGEVQLDVEVDDDPEWTRPLVDGRATFTNLYLGDFARFVRVQRADGARGPLVRIAALNAQHPEREVVLADVAPQPRLVFRPIHPNGSALPRTWLDVTLDIGAAPTDAEIAGGSEDSALGVPIRLEGTVSFSGGGEIVARWSGIRDTGSGMRRVGEQYRRALLTDSRGFLELPLPGACLDAENLTLVVSFERDGTTLTSEPRRVERGGLWTDLDLGNVPLLEPAPQDPPVK